MLAFVKVGALFVNVAHQGGGSEKIVLTAEPMLWHVINEKNIIRVLTPDKTRAWNAWDKDSPDLVLWKYKPTSKNAVWTRSLSDKFALRPNVNANFKAVLKEDGQLKMSKSGTSARFELVPWTLGVVSYNLAYNVMENFVGGSEKPHVKKCQLHHKKFNGWADSKQEISGCSLNAARITVRETMPNNRPPDLVGMQETNPSRINAFFKAVQTFAGQTAHYEMIRNGNCAILFNTFTMGRAVPLTPNNFTFGPSKTKKGRCLQAVAFPLHNLVFINFHAQHNITIQKALEKTDPMLRQALADKELPLPTRVVATADTNDTYGKFKDKTFTVMGKTLAIPKGNDIPVTCCDASNGFVFVGDYVFDSQKTPTKYFGLPPGWDPKTLASDHFPVVLFDL